MSKCDVYQIITDRIIKLLDAGTIPWRKPWHSPKDLPKNLITKKAYRGINVFLLQSMGYGSPYWLTFNQARSLGGRVRRGEKACPVVFWKWLEVEEEQETKRIPVIRYYRVFNVDQVDGLPKTNPPSEKQNTFSPIEAAQLLVDNMPGKPEIREGSSQASYGPAQDIVFMPFRESFQTPEEYYSTLYHELIHASGHPRRLNRSGISMTSHFGSDAYSKEELIAEMGAAFLCGQCGIENRVIENSAAYIQHWLKRLRQDRRLVVTAAAQAQKACDFVLGEHPIE